MLTFAVIDPMLLMFFVANIGTVHFMTQRWVLTTCWVLTIVHFIFLHGPNIGL